MYNNLRFLGSVRKPMPLPRITSSTGSNNFAFYLWLPRFQNCNKNKNWFTIDAFASRCNLDSFTILLKNLTLLTLLVLLILLKQSVKAKAKIEAIT